MTTPVAPTSAPAAAVVDLKTVLAGALAALEAFAKQFGETELKAAAPELVALGQSALTHIEANMSGVVGSVEKTALNALFAAASKALLSAASA